jgi:hypothetical protein
VRQVPAGGVGDVECGGTSLDHFTQHLHGHKGLQEHIKNRFQPVVSGMLSVVAPALITSPSTCMAIKGCRNTHYIGHNAADAALTCILGPPPPWLKVFATDLCFSCLGCFTCMDKA